MENAGNQKLKLLKITKKIHTFYFCQLFALRPLPMRSNLPEVYPKDTMVASHQFEVITLFFFDKIIVIYGYFILFWFGFAPIKQQICDFF